MPERVIAIQIIAKTSASREKLRIRMMSRNPGPPVTLPLFPLPELRTLTLEDRHVKDASELASFLKLEHVAIDWWKGNEAEWSTIIGALGTSCRKVQKKSLDANEMDFKAWSDVPEAEEARLFISYGKQVREAELFHFPTAMCEVILGRCMNARCKWTSKKASCSDVLNKFTVRVPRLKSINFSEMESEWLESTTEREQLEVALP